MDSPTRGREVATDRGRGEDQEASPTLLRAGPERTKLGNGGSAGPATGCEAAQGCEPPLRRSEGRLRPVREGSCPQASRGRPCPPPAGLRCLPQHKLPHRSRGTRLAQWLLITDRGGAAPGRAGRRRLGSPAAARGLPPPRPPLPGQRRGARPGAL